ncbi:MAG: DDE-type integrase/transposase/recombinase [Gammaproteobacteria bacterium]
MEQFLVMENSLVEWLKTAGLSQTKALALLGIAAGTWHYRSNPRPKVVEPVPHNQRRSPAWLSETELREILAMQAAAFVQDKSVHQAFYEALDAATPIASLKTWYRVCTAHLNHLRPVRPRKKHASASMPQWDADAVGQVWCWDITMLPGPYKTVSFCFYMAMDVFSRKIVAWRVEQHEDDALARAMFEAAFAVEGLTPTLVHSDRGAAMTSRTLTGLFGLLGINASKNRPRVSNDNPYAETVFKTAKHAGFGYPRYFQTLDEARAWVRRFVHQYNTEHRHRSLEGHTPDSIHDGSWIQIHHQRQATVDALYAEHPERFNKPPKIKTPLAQTVLNQKKTEHRLQTG